MTPELEMDEDYLSRIIQEALREDLGAGDVTTESIVGPSVACRGEIVARSSMVVAGLPVARQVFASFDADVRFEERIGEGERGEANQVLAVVAGPARAILSAERLSLNFLQRLSGIATMTRRYVDLVAPYRAKIYDTRKTTPGLRSLEKYAVRVGGGCNHRSGLYDQVLVKDNHIAIARDILGIATIGELVARVKERVPSGTVIEVEVTSLEQLTDALASAADIVLLDNMDIEVLREACARRDQAGSSCLLEASGGITEAHVAAVAETGVDRISVGALTHSAPSADISLEITGQQSS